ncbi:hypothetical protein [Actinomadura opuntiae]|uniref:hypothetical protein n=1 Tax=Actinomadura sp. OS1-43 TaxID=604315 RepID=UPI00255AE440|nr:hypothetical protein [Actinomadura sp. OS1-43]MDL4817335.1 hypothetical protein [Actinomadura sp. OS1-43]
MTKGLRGKYIVATKLVSELVEAADELVPSKTIARYGRVDPLCIDEVGYMGLDRLTCNGVIIETGTDSYRFAETRA